MFILKKDSVNIIFHTNFYCKIYSYLLKWNILSWNKKNERN